MDILLEKIYKVVTDFSKLRYIDQEVIEHFRINTDYQEGSFTSYQEIKEWREYQTGNFWGGKSQYCWFKTKVAIPERFQGKKVVFAISTGHKEGWDVSNPQFLIYVNDVLRQGLDVNHKHTLLSEKAESGSAYSIVLLGHSGIEEEKVILTSALKVIDPLLEDFYYNLSNLFWTLSLMDVQNHQRPELLRKLVECVDQLDLRREDSEEFYHSVEAANEYLVKNYYTEVDKSGPVVTTIGHTHIDVAWLWTIEQTKEKVVRSFSTVLELMEQFPEYQFMSSQPQLYEYAKIYEPQLFERIKEKVKEGRWEVDGGMWLEADCNLPSGESLSRQFLYGTQFIKKEFDVDCKTLWLPDVFGYSAALPQLIKKSGLSYMMTSKLDWNSHNKMPHDTFIWRGIDGSEILTHLITTTNAASYHEDIYQKREDHAQTTYNGRLNPNQVKGTWTRYQDQLLSEETLQLFGFGDGGGGPTEEMLENYKRLRYGLPGIPRTAMDFQKHYFQRLQSKVEVSPYIKKWQGELYLEFHQGTYTSMAKNKRANRKAEFLYQKVEFINTLAHLINHEYSYPSEEIRANWKRVLLYQFHDIIPGTSISEVYQVTDQGYQDVFKNGDKLINKAMTAFCQEMKWPKDSCVVVNPLSHARTDLVSFEVDCDEVVTKVTDGSGRAYPVFYDSSENKYQFIAQEIPPKGLKCYQLHLEHDKKVDIKSDKPSEFLSSTDKVKEIKNRYYHIRFNEAMEIISLYDQENHREMIRKDGRGNILQLFEDRPRRFDNWNIDASYKDKVYEIDHVESVEIIEDNPFYTGVRVTRKYGLSTLIQKIFMYHHHKRIDFCTEADWHEKHVLLKAAFEIDLNTEQATYDIQYGNVTRATHNNTGWEEAQYEVCAHKWADVSEGGYGISLMNDCKYGHDIKENCMRLTLIKCGTYPNEEADQGLHQFTYSIYGHDKTWREADTSELAYNLNVPLWAYRVEEVARPAIGHEVTGQEARSEVDSVSFLRCKDSNVIIDTIKMAENGDGIIIRLFENKNIRCRAQFTTLFNIKKVMLCDLVENPLEAINFEGNTFELDIKGYEVITLKIAF